jgi:hypothetical protein
MSYLGKEVLVQVRSYENKQQELEALQVDEQLKVQPDSRRVGLVSLGRKLKELKHQLIVLTLGEQTVALSGRCSLGLRESKCVFLDAHPIQQVLLRLEAVHKSKGKQFQ